jgi:uncharacterized protein (TIGR02996 family)
MATTTVRELGSGRTWDERSRLIIESVLEQLGPEADYEQKYQALREAYPFGERKHFPYRVWCKEVSAALIGVKSKYKPIGGLTIPPRAPPDVKPFLQTILDHPELPGPRLVLADYLEERGDPRGEQLRESPKVTVLRAARMYQRVSGFAAVETIRGMIEDVLKGRTRLIIEKDVVLAVELCKTIDALKLFRGRQN